MILTNQNRGAVIRLRQFKVFKAIKYIDFLKRICLQKAAVSCK